MSNAQLSHLAVPGAQIALRVTPKASSNRITGVDGQIRVYVTTVRENGMANAVAQKRLVNALGVPKSCLLLLRGQTSRDKIFRVD